MTCSILELVIEHAYRVWQIPLEADIPANRSESSGSTISTVGSTSIDTDSNDVDYEPNTTESEESLDSSFKFL